MKCGLQKPEGITTWPETAAKKFVELSAEGQTIFTLKKLGTGETSIVQLLLNDDDIVMSIMGDSSIGSDSNNDVTSTEEGYVTEIRSLQNLHIEVAGEAKITNCRLDTIDGESWNEEATTKFKDINQEGN